MAEGEGWLARLRAGLARSRQGFVARLRAAVGLHRTVDEALFDELEEVLITGDVGVEATRRLVDGLRQRWRSQGWRSSEEVLAALRQEMAEVLQGGPGGELDLGGRPSVLLFAGVNGVGKTTTIGKLARQLVERGHRPILAAADTFRAAAAEQLAVWAERAGCELVRHGPGADPAAVAFDAIQAARARGADAVLVDTAGRLHTKNNLMEELRKIDRVIARAAPGEPRERLLVLDATTGQNALQQARLFREAIGLTGVILTKLDGTGRGGIVFAVRQQLGLPVRWIGVGERIDDLRPFDPESFLDALFTPLETTPAGGGEEAR
ncbi:MAG: signal recognition particle-docking protein FtsY [Bacillota bacterium]|nr:signal recognition particle-docking protein FtsY [Bacillota bacterium]